MINFNASPEEFAKIIDISERATRAGWQGNHMSTLMDLSACHLNGCPLDLDRMLEADDFNLMHDVAGIARHIDRNTGKLTRCFLPRFAKPAA